MDRTMRGWEAFVATANPDDSHHNTLVLSGIELIIPLEADLDGDPNSPDSVKLLNEDGAYEAILTVGDPEVNQDGDNPLYYYHFQFVPLGRYRVQVKIGSGWCTVISALKVTHEGAFRGDESFEGKPDGSKLGTPRPTLQQP